MMSIITILTGIFQLAYGSEGGRYKSGCKDPFYRVFTGFYGIFLPKISAKISKVKDHKGNFVET